MRHTLYYSVLLLSLGSVTLTACNQDQQTTKITQTQVKKYSQATSLSGMVSNDKGAVNLGIVTVTDESGRYITEAAVSHSHYRVDIPANTVLPIVLTFSSGDSAEKLVAVAVSETTTNYFINPSTTAIAKKAEAMGGYTRANMVRAAEDSVHTPDANKTTTGWRGDPTTQYGGWH